MRIPSLVCFLAVAAVAVAAGDLSLVRNVYLLPMQAGLDQYLANRLTEKRLLNVVTDPKQADAVLTDRIGEGFEERLNELYPDEAAKPKDEDKDDKNSWVTNRPRSASFSRGRGTLFLIDRKTRDVLWSTYSPSRSGRPADLHKNAGEVVKRMDESIHPGASKPAAK